MCRLSKFGKVILQETKLGNKIGGGIVKHLSDELLLETYRKASELKLNPDFLRLMEIEIQTRALTHMIKPIAN